jgi:hypothetical protein
MKDLFPTAHQVQCVTSFQGLVSTPFYGEINAICWTRELEGDFAEIVQKAALIGNISELSEEALLHLQLSVEGQLAREILLRDLKALKEHGAAPILNLINGYNRDNAYPFFPTDVYSFHVDRSPIPTDTFLCTYYGDCSEIIPNAEAEQKIHIPEIRTELRKLYDGPDEGFEAFLIEHFFDLHYQAKPNAQTINLGLGHIWRLAIDHPELQVQPCVHRAPVEKSGQTRLLLIC